MCIGLPMRIVDASGGSALAERGGVRVLADGEAAHIDAALEAMKRVLHGGDGIDTLFADLDRAPLLPPHLRGA
jgi:hypothetical protein